MAPPPRSAAPNPGIPFARTRALVALLLAGLVFAVFFRTAWHGFTNYDDDLFITKSPHVLAGINPEGVRWAVGAGFFGTDPHVDYWRPLSFLSHMLDVQCFGLWAGGHHLVNVLLHAASTALLFLALLSMTGRMWRSALVAALFGIHPLHVESVAWMAERKDVLSGLFFMLTLWAYARYARAPSVGRYLPVAVFLALGLLSKPMLVTLPCVLLLLDFWPLDRWRREPWWRLTGEKIPLFALALFDILATLSSQGSHMRGLEVVTFPMRLGNAAVGCVTYLQKGFLPTGLCALYDLPAVNRWWPLWRMIGSEILLVALTLMAILQCRRRPYLPVGWFWFLGILVPVAGLVQVGNQAYADRYTYLSMMGVWIALVWLAGEAIAGMPDLRRPARILAVLAVLALSVGAWWQTGFWRDSRTLWERVIEVHEDSSGAHNGLGTTLIRMGREKEGRVHVERALQLDSNLPEARFNLGVLLDKEGKHREAAVQYREGLRADPENPMAHSCLADALGASGDVAGAIAEYREALRIDPLLTAPRRGLIHALKVSGDPSGAVLEAENLLLIEPGDATTLYQLANLLQQTGRSLEAAIRFSESLRLAPREVPVLNDAAWLLATSPDPSVRDGRRAVELASEAGRLTSWSEPGVLDTLAAAQAESGEYARAAGTARLALNLARARGDQQLARNLTREISLYDSGKPLRDGQ